MRKITKEEHRLIKRIEKMGISTLTTRLKSLEELYDTMETLQYKVRGFTVSDDTHDVVIPKILWEAIKSIYGAKNENDED